MAASKEEKVMRVSTTIAIVLTLAKVTGLAGTASADIIIQLRSSQDPLALRPGDTLTVDVSILGLGE